MMLVQISKDVLLPIQDDVIPLDEGLLDAAVEESLQIVDAMLTLEHELEIGNRMNQMKGSRAQHLYSREAKRSQDAIVGATRKVSAARILKTKSVAIPIVYDQSV